ncbi:uncharacterized protein LY89DRAFT_580200 [Mollisia scopiformis]|uniref:Uncharacterized protein n=1 Tax=Mollisia scopiformis TaxID=149040 RepID=A0A194XHX3_MOLSC|nr:uncharacterized protein LY89DRAFT_580200 [Mollisia scopiformis]KUJ19820.1 hypothetical protein LY89DRAFT_580200 [Mollisia scopiformis]
MEFINSILECLGASSHEATLRVTSNAHTRLEQPPYKNDPAEEELAARILNTLFTSEKSGDALAFQLQSHFSTSSWTESLARRILDGIVAALASGQVLVGAMQETYDKVQVVAEDFVKEHPILTEVILTVIAIGILALLVPWAVEALGFGELGPSADSFAAWWQSTFPDAEAGSLFSYLQRLGMKRGKA